MNFNNKFFGLDCENQTNYIVFYDNSIYKGNWKKTDKNTIRSITIGLTYIIYFADSYYFTPFLKKIFETHNYLIFMNIIRCLSFMSFFIPFYLMKRSSHKNKIKIKNNLNKNFEILSESSLEYLHIKKKFFQNIYLYSTLFLVLLVDMWLLFFFKEKEYFLQMVMVMVLSIIGFLFGTEDFISSFVWMYKYLKRHKNDENK